MTLPASGPISTADISQEIYGNTTTTIVIPDATTRTLTGKASGDLILPDDFWGKTWLTATLNFTLTSGTGPGGTPAIGYSNGPVNSYGSISPTTTALPWAASYNLQQLQNFTSSPILSCALTPNTYNVATHGHFNVIIDGNTFNTSTATISTNANNIFFQWSDAVGLLKPSGSVHSCTLGQ